MNDFDEHLKKVLECKLEALTDFRNKVFDQRKDPITASQVIDLLNADIATLEGMINE
jgi:hypothetical protein